jgi:hypothetical protein
MAAGRSSRFFGIELQRGAELGDGGGEVRFLQVGCAQVLLETGVIGMEANGFLKLLNSSVGISAFE